MRFLIYIGITIFLVSCSSQAETKNVENDIKNNILKFKQNGDYLSAVDLLSKEISLNPNSAWLYAERGDCYRVLYEKDTTKKIFIQNSLADYLKAIPLEPNQKRYISRAEIYTMLDRKKEALDDYNSALNFKNGNRARSLMERGSFYFEQMKDSLKAFSDFRTAINEFRDSAYLYLRYANYLLESGRLDDAIYNFTCLTEEFYSPSDKLSRTRKIVAEMHLVDIFIEKEDYFGALQSANSLFTQSSEAMLYVKFKLGQQEFAKREMKKLGERRKAKGDPRSKYYFYIFPNEPKTPQEEIEIKKSELKWPNN